MPKGRKRPSSKGNAANRRNIKKAQISRVGIRGERHKKGSY